MIINAHEFRGGLKSTTVPVSLWLIPSTRLLQLLHALIVEWIIHKSKATARTIQIAASSSDFLGYVRDFFEYS